MKVLSKEELMVAINDKYPNLSTKEGGLFSSQYKSGIWVCGEDGATDKKGMRIFNYYASGNLSKYYDIGVLSTFVKFLSDRGWFAEWYDCGTAFLWEA